MKKLKLSVILGFVLFSTQGLASSINIVQTYNTTGVALVVESAPDSIIKRLSSMPNISIYSGKCSQVAGELKRQVACLTNEQSGKLKITTPIGIEKKKETNIPYLGTTIQEELAVTHSIYKAITRGKPSPFDNRVAFISKKGDGHYLLRVAFYDGSVPVTLHKSTEPLLSPSWSPDGRYLTYVSFESIRASIFVHDIRTNKRIKILTLKGLNAYPSFDSNSSLLVSVSNEKMTSEIHRLDILSGKLTKLKTSNRADIFPRRLSDTSYVKVGLSTSDVPYGYVVTNDQQKPISSQPLNAISLSEAGDLVALSGQNIVFMNKKKHGWGDMVTIARGNHLESPSISSDGSIIYYSTKENGRVFIKAASNQGKNILSFRVSDEDLIQISVL